MRFRSLTRLRESTRRGDNYPIQGETVGRVALIIRSERFEARRDRSEQEKSKGRERHRRTWRSLVPTNHYARPGTTSQQSEPRKR